MNLPTTGGAPGLRAADLRFLLPDAPASASVDIPAVAGRTLSSALARAGIAVTDRRGGPVPHVHVTAARRPPPPGPGSHVVHVGRLPHFTAPRRAHVAPYLVLPGPHGPAMLALATAEVRQYLATTWSRPSSLRGRVRNRLLASPAGGLAAGLVVLSDHRCLPHPVAQALRAVPELEITGWVFLLREGDELQRIVALVFGGRGVPEVAVKFSRRPGAPARGQHEAAVLDELAVLAPDHAARATSVLHTGVLGGSELTVERAAPGTVLAAWLQRPRGAGRHVVERLVDWSVSLSRVTSRDDDAGRNAWLTHALQPYGAMGVATRLARIPVAVAHQDLGSWNVVVTDDDFVVVDWESATTAGLPLADTAYLITDLLVHEHGPHEDAARTAWAVELWAGALPESSLLQRDVRAASHALGLDDAQSSAIVTSCWLHHGLSRMRRAEVMGQGSAGGGYLGDLAERWLRDSRLGADWAGPPAVGARNGVS